MPINVNGDTISSNSLGSNSLINNVVLNGLQCYLDAGDKNSYPGSGNVWYDLSGLGKHATWNATPSWTSNGAASFFSPYGNMCRGLNSENYGLDNTTGYSIIWASQTNNGVQTPFLNLLHQQGHSQEEFSFTLVGLITQFILTKEDVVIQTLEQTIHLL